LLKNLVIFTITYGISAVLFFIVSKKLKFYYSFKYFSFYYLIYSPLWGSVFSYYFIKGLLYRRIGIDLKDWKIQ